MTDAASERPAFGMRPAAAGQVPDPGPPGETPLEEDLLPDDGTVDLRAERRDSGIDQVLEAFDADLIGLVPV